MATNNQLKRKHDIAYACFIPPGLVYLIGGIAPYLAMDTGTAGGVGFLILIPLALAVLASVPLGLYYSLLFWRDRVLVFLAVITLIMLVQLFAELGSVKFRNLVGLLYGVTVLLIETNWFLMRRGRIYTA
ncbi:MAG: hypothetical protein GYB33_09925 [Gammaproteobacteria bacterium]|nr:hypothetical protein [Gammaproteobacteria bacterium]